MMIGVLALTSGCTKGEGKAEEMEKILKKDGLKESWEVVKKAYQQCRKENKGK